MGFERIGSDPLRRGGAEYFAVAVDRGYGLG